jgi:hypothetical protein
LQSVKSPVGLKLTTTKSQLSAGARCRIDALEAKFRQALKSAGPGATPQSMLSQANVGGDIAELAYVVLMSATNDEDEDLKLIMAETKAQTSEKQALRNLMSSPHAGSLDASTIEAQSMKLPPGPCVTAVMTMPTPDPQIAMFRSCESSRDRAQSRSAAAGAWK